MLKSAIHQAKENKVSLGEKVQVAAAAMMAIQGHRDKFAEHAVLSRDYYDLLGQWRLARNKLAELLVEELALNKPAIDVNVFALVLEERRAIKEANVTCTTYERAHNRLMKQAEGFVSGKLR